MLSMLTESFRSAQRVSWIMPHGRKKYQYETGDLMHVEAVSIAVKQREYVFNLNELEEFFDATKAYYSKSSPASTATGTPPLRRISRYPRINGAR